MQDNTTQDNTMQGNPDGFETTQKMGNDQENSGQFLHHSEIGKWSGKIRMVVKLFGKLEMIWKNPYSQVFSIIAKKILPNQKKIRVAMLPC